MSLNIERRLFLSGSGALAAAYAAPAFAKRKGSKKAAQWIGVQTMLDKTVADKYVPGAAGAIARGTEEPVFFTAGTLSKKSSTLITPDSLWRAYSMTKPITGIAAMMLIEDGKLKMDQNIADLLPGFANPRVLTNPAASLESRPAKSPITVRNLLTHTAGLGYTIITKGPLLEEYMRLGLYAGQVSRKPLPGFSGTAPHPASLADMADRLASLPLMFDPGSRWSYSISLDLLGRVIEVASGMSFDAFLQQRIFKPLGMTSSFFQVPASDAARLTTNHVQSPLGTMAIDPGDDSIYLDKPPYPFGGAGLVCSMRDYDRFLQMLTGYGAIGKKRIMKPDTARIAMSNLVHPDTIMEGLVKGQGFGAGGRVTIKDDPLGSGIGTFGWGGAASTIGWVDPTRGLRASGWVQIMTSGGQPFVESFGKTVYAAR